MINDIIKLKKNTFQIIIILILLVVISPSQNIQLYITGNINGAVVDCQCEDTKNGSLARLMTFYNRIYHDDQIWVDAGNFLTSYRFPEHNSFFLDYFSQIKYDIICLSDQEFLHGDTFFTTIIIPEFPQKLLFSNYNKKNPSIKNIKSIQTGDVRFHFLNIWTKIHFGMLNDLTVHNIIENEIMKLKKGDILILILQDEIEEAEKILKKYPQITGLIVGNNQEDSLQLNLTNKSFILSPGIEAEKIGCVELELKNKKIINIKAELIDLRELAEEDTGIIENYNRFNETLK